MQRIAFMQRIALWVLVGATVSCFWTLVMVLTGPHHNIGHWPVVTITIPASLFRRNQPVTYYEVMFLNAGLYGLIGLALEPLFRLHRHSPAKSR
jgi:hypothetical protein